MKILTRDSFYRELRDGAPYSIIHKSGHVIGLFTKGAGDNLPYPMHIESINVDDIVRYGDHIPINSVPDDEYVAIQWVQVEVDAIVNSIKAINNGWFNQSIGPYTIIPVKELGWNNMAKLQEVLGNKELLLPAAVNPENVESLKQEIANLTGVIQHKSSQVTAFANMARHTAWLAFCYNDHNFQYDPKYYALECMRIVGTTNLDQANDLLEGIFPCNDVKVPLPIPVHRIPNNHVLISKTPIHGDRYNDGLWSMRNWEALLADQEGQGIQTKVIPAGEVLDREQIDQVLAKHGIIVEGLSKPNDKLLSAIKEIVNLAKVTIYTSQDF